MSRYTVRPVSDTASQKVAYAALLEKLGRASLARFVQYWMSERALSQKMVSAQMWLLA